MKNIAKNPIIMLKVYDAASLAVPGHMQVGGHGMDPPSVVTLRKPTHSLKHGVRTKGRCSQMQCLPRLLHGILYLCGTTLVTVPAKLEFCAAGTSKWCDLRWREGSGSSFVSSSSFILVWIWISHLLWLEPQRHLPKGGQTLVFSLWFSYKIRVRSKSALKKIRIPDS